MPTPNADESKEDFISRCIPIVLEDGTTDDPKQAAAICYSLWKKSEEKSMDNDIKHRFDPCERILDSDPSQLKLTCVMATENKAVDGWALSASGFSLHSGGDSIPLLWVHGYGRRDELPLGSVKNIRAEKVKAGDAEVMAVVGDKFYYQPGEAVAHLTNDLVTMPAVVFDMRKQGLFKSVSIGFKPLEILPEDQVGDDGINVKRWSLFELSDCPVGMDPYALDRVMAERALTETQRDWLVGRECHRCGKCNSEEEHDKGNEPVKRQEPRGVFDLFANVRIPNPWRL